jgi:hypothetical protein
VILEGEIGGDERIAAPPYRETNGKLS